MTRKKVFFIMVIGIIFSGIFLEEVLMAPSLFSKSNKEVIALPEVERRGAGSFSDLMYKRRSVRSFVQGQMTLDQVSKLLFAAQGITRQDRFRTVPSAGALYPLEVYIVTGPVQNLESGIYKYQSQDHQLMQISTGDKRRELARESFGQMWVSEAQTILVICAVYERVTSKYGQRGVQYVHIEAGCAAQNVSLEGYNLGLGSTVVGAFSDSGISEVIKADKKEKPLIVMPVGLIN